MREGLPVPVYVPMSLSLSRVLFSLFLCLYFCLPILCHSLPFQFLFVPHFDFAPLPPPIPSSSQCLFFLIVFTQYYSLSTRLLCVILSILYFVIESLYSFTPTTFSLSLCNLRREWEKDMGVRYSIQNTRFVIEAELEFKNYRMNGVGADRNQVVHTGIPMISPRSAGTVFNVRPQAKYWLLITQVTVQTDRQKDRPTDR